MNNVPKPCAVCGALFTGTARTCSPECRRALQSRSASHRKTPNKWNAAARKKFSEKHSTDPALLNITAAARQTNASKPGGGRGGAHRNALKWILISPEDVEYTAYSLKDWALRNCALFDTDPANYRRIVIGFNSIAQSMRRKGCRASAPVSTYKGWRLRSLPEPLTDDERAEQTALFLSGKQ